jgi:hypothetical protein
MHDCRTGGTRGRLGIVLKGILKDALPSDMHLRANGTTFVGVTQLTPLGQAGPKLISQYESPDDVINALLTSVSVCCCYRYITCNVKCLKPATHRRGAQKEKLSFF